MLQKKITCNEISPERFIWEETGIRLGYHVFDFIAQDNKGNTWRINQSKYKLIGWCDGSKLAVRPSTGQIAVLFEVLDDDETLDKVWIHFPNIFKNLFDINDTNRSENST